MPARMIDEDAAHHLRRQAIELGSILLRHVRLADEPQIRLVHEGGWLQRVVATLAPQVAGGLAPEFPMHEDQQRIAGLLIAVSPRLQQIGDAVHSFSAVGPDQSARIIADPLGCTVSHFSGRLRVKARAVPTTGTGHREARGADRLAASDGSVAVGGAQR